MGAATATVTSPSPPSFLNSHLRRGHRPASTTTIAFFARHFGGVKPSPNHSRGKSAPVAYPEDVFGALEAELWRLRRLVELQIHRLGSEADAAYRDLRSAVREVSGDRVVLTFRRSSLRYFAGALLFLLACAVAARVLLGMVFLRGGGGGWGGDCGVEMKAAGRLAKKGPQPGKEGGGGCCVVVAYGGSWNQSCPRASKGGLEEVLRSEDARLVAEGWSHGDGIWATDEELGKNGKQIGPR